jgi:hypothetical protein
VERLANSRRHREAGDHCCLWRNQLVPETLVWPFFMIVVGEFSDGRPEVALAKRHHSV